MKEKLSILTELIKLARADNEVKQEEYDLLLTVAESLGVAKDDFDQLFNKYVEFDPPPFEMRRIEQFYRMVLLANVDLEVSSTEIENMKEAGLKLGLHPDAIEMVLDEMKKNELGMIPPEQLIQIFKVHHN